MKQWSAAPSRISLAPLPTEAEIEKAHDKWADPAMPENFQLLLPHTQQLLRIARSGRYGTKRKNPPDAEPDADEFTAREEDGLAEELSAKPIHHEEKGFMARKWRQVPESALVPEHLHWEFLAKRRKGLPNFYHGGPTEISTAGIPQIAKRKTRVQKVLDPATGDSVIYEVVALEGQVLENELPAESQMQATRLEPGTTIEGLGTANDEGLINLVPANPVASSRRNRPPQKKKGGPGRGKKRVTFTNPDGSTYTTIVPNATKIVPQPGQTVKHVAKGEDAGKDVSMEEAARLANENGEQGEGEGDDDDDEEGDDGDDDDDDDDKEDGEIQENDPELAATPAKKPSAEPPVVESTPMDVEQPKEPTPGALTPKAPTPTENTPQLESAQQPTPANEPQANTDVEMQDMPAEETEQPPAAPFEALATESLTEVAEATDRAKSPEKPQQDVEVEMQDRPADEPELQTETKVELAEVEVSDKKSPEKSEVQEELQQPEGEVAAVSERVVEEIPAEEETVPSEPLPTETVPSEPAESEPAPAPAVDEPVQESAPEPVVEEAVAEGPAQESATEKPASEEPVPETTSEPTAPPADEEQAAEAPEPVKAEAAQAPPANEVASEQQPADTSKADETSEKDVAAPATESDKAPEPEVEEPKAEEPAQEREETPAKTEKQGEEDLLGSLEKSLE